ncbi:MULTISPECIES: hypothetical protein [Bacillus cereus group]|uniref:hypothetical protein n=1 Tax=Bacillus cereus group TaxID=86661 RepID=UPI0015D0D570|nr:MULTISPECIES: hypothetical protein [Bacillus cereus group]
MNWPVAIEEGLKWIQSLGIFTVGTAAITGIIGYLFKTIFAHVLNKQLEDHKTALNKQISENQLAVNKQLEDHKTALTRQIDEHKSELQKLENKHQIIFNKLHENRAETIKVLYSKFVDLENKMINLTKLFQAVGEKSMKEKADEASISYWDFLSFYSVNRIYFNEDVCGLIDKIEKEIRGILVSTGVYELHLIESGPGSNVSPEQTEIWLENWRRIEKDVPKLKRNLEGEFRKLLGVNEG